MIYKMLTLFRSQRKAIYSFGSLQFVMGKAHNKQGTSTGVTTSTTLLWWPFLGYIEITDVNKDILAYLI